MGQFASILWTSRSFSSNLRLVYCLHYSASNSRQVLLELDHVLRNRVIESLFELGEGLETLFVI